MIRLESNRIVNAYNQEVLKSKIEVNNLNFYYGEKHILKDINLKIFEKKVTAIIGPSGCGKSTFIRLLNRMDEFSIDAKSSGEILINGENILNDEINRVELRRKVGMVFQKPNPFPKTVFDNVAYGPRLHGSYSRSQLNEIVERALKRAALWEEVSDRLHQNALGLSGGQQQRLCIARALAVDPDILLMDEPTSALDPRSTSRIEDLIAELRGHYTIIIVTHNMQQAARVSDLTAFLFEGLLIEFGKTEQIFQNPREKQTQDYITGRFG